MILSPFEVAAESDTGYMASNTLAGSRLSSSLLATPVSISVFTKDLLADLAASDVMESVRYALSATPKAVNSPSNKVEANIFWTDRVEFRGFGNPLPAQAPEDPVSYQLNPSRIRSH